VRFCPVVFSASKPGVFCKEAEIFECILHALIAWAHSDCEGQPTDRPGSVHEKNGDRHEKITHAE